MPPPRILDVCCGPKMWHYDKKADHILYADRRQEDAGFMESRPKRTIQPDVLHDYTALPYRDGVFDLILWDPPQLVQNADVSILETFGSLRPETWPAEFRDAFRECMRVLRPGGSIIFKWNDHDISVDRVLQVFPIQPTIGTRSRKGARSSTFYFVFYKM